jgi:hypothetical protein
VIADRSPIDSVILNCRLKLAKTQGIGSSLQIEVEQTEQKRWLNLQSLEIPVIFCNNRSIKTAKL